MNITLKKLKDLKACSEAKEFIQRMIFKLFTIKYMRQQGSGYIGYQVRCLKCGKFYTPAKIACNDPLHAPEILVNNWCSRKCYG